MFIRALCTWPASGVALVAALLLTSTSRDVLAQQPYDDLDAETRETSKKTQAARDDVKEAPQVTPVEPPTSSDAQARYSFGLRIGGGYNTLLAPSDPAGTPTLLYGSKFTGGALQLGAQAGLVITNPTPKLAVGIDAGIMYGWMRGRGFAENAERTQRQTVTFTGHTLRMPLLLALRTTGDSPVGFRAGVGPEFLVGLASTATVRFEQIAASPEPISSTPTTHVGVMGLLGLHYRARRFDIPLELRFTWDPQVGDSTVERFEGYESEESPGSYQVAFTMHLHLTTGVEWHF